MLSMKTTAQVQSESHPPWEDWEDHGGFDDEEALMGKKIIPQSAPFQERPWYSPSLTNVRLNFNTDKNIIQQRNCCIR